MQADAACRALDASARLALRVGLAGSDAFRVAAGARIVFGAGCKTLRGCMALCRQQAGRACGDVRIAATAHIQMWAAFRCILRLGAQPAALAAFAASAALPGAAVPWLAAVSEALLLQPLGSAEGAEDLNCKILGVSTAGSLLGAGRQHQLLH